MNMTPYFLAVDGGGTHCRAVLSDGRTRWQARGGSANVSTDFDVAIASISAVARDVAAQVGLAEAALHTIPVYLGLAGMTGPDMAARVVRALPFARIKVEEDCHAALRGALGLRDGAMAHCGTGSFLAAQAGGAARFIGGWGAVLGDEASAQWLGRRALAETLNAVDGMRAMTPLAEALLTQLDGTAGIMRFAVDAGPAEFGSLAQQVTGAKGDALARELMQAGADYIADRAGRLGWQAGQVLCLTGGLGPCYAGYLPAAMQAALAEPLGDPMSGALALAQEMRDG